ncbi:signal transducer and activator of transcription 6 [Pseudochaenichthys georgianus]|uniref:signal transducer and activator of transcription 6 n=1 Tax=Pseudochaenichthys georgianus TaxID=52239 RepID=UPI00146DE542|nr:signal transducer and activator of transcription 6 [Pseudochaenichthys georgianus]XP_033942844.1 signal transducer and activator of transcription 6 [Pseudochaenichthys georgianus]
MAQWIHMSQMIQRLSDDTVNNLYPQTAFPIEVRHFLAEWIESQRWDNFALEKVELESQAQTLLDQTISMLQSISQQNANVVDRMKLMQISRNMTMLNKQPLRFAVMVKETLAKERALLGTLPQTPSSTPQYQQHQNRENSFPSMQDVDHLVLKVLEVQDIRQKMHQLQEELNWERQNCEGLQGPIQQNGMDPKNSEIQKLQNHIQQLEYNVKALATKRFQLLKECVDCLDQCQTRLISKLKAWRWEQHKSTIGHPFDENLHPLQTWCEQLLGVNGKLRQELMLIGEPIPELQERLGKLLQVLIQSSLMVEKQPPQVIKTQSKFCTTVRYLLGEKVASGKPVVLKAQIMNEMQARNLGSVPGDNVGELINNTAILEHNAVSKSTCATFRNMSIKKIKRADRRGSESVTEEKFALLFSAEITITGCDTPYRIQMISLPVVVIVHGSQDNNALATIIWDCAFSESDRVPFMVPERVPWRMMYSTLNSKFTSEVQTNHNLDHYNQHFLAQKIFDKPDFADDFSNMLVSWGQFNKEVLPGRTFTFWQWFEGVMDLSKKHLKTYWSEGLIFGFIGKQHLHLILKDRPNGTFLLRFSDSEIGGITIAYVSATENGGQKIQNIQPFTKKDLDIHNLGDCIRDINDITYLYPAFPKDEVFKRFYSEPRASLPGGYIPVSLQTRVGTEGREGSSAIPLTPSMTLIAVSPASNIYPVNQFQQEQDMEGGPSGEFSGFNDQASANMEIDFESLLENLPE